MYLADKSVPFRRNGADELRILGRFPQDLSEDEDVLSEVRFLDCRVRPDGIEDLVLCKQPSVGLDQQQEEVKDAGRKRDFFTRRLVQAPIPG